MQKCVAGDVILSEKGDVRRRMATLAELRCTPCQRLISQGKYYCKSTAPGERKKMLMKYPQTALSVAKVASIFVKTAIGRDGHALLLMPIGCSPTFVQMWTRRILFWLPTVYAAKPVT